MTLSFTSAQGYKSTTTSSNSYNKYTDNAYSNSPTLNYNYRTSQTFNKYPTRNYNYQRNTYRNYPNLNYNYRTSQTFNKYPTRNYNYQRNTYRNYPNLNYNYRTTQTFKRAPTRSYNYLRYTSTGNYERYSGFFGNEINEYKVYVRNRERKGGYFTTRFYLTDYYGKTRSESVTHYLKPNEERRFVYKNVYSDGREYKSRNYKIVSHTRY